MKTNNYKSMIHRLGGLLLFLACSWSVSAQWRESPFPTEAPTSGYRFEALWPHMDWTGPNRPQGITSRDGAVYVSCRYGRVWRVSNPGSRAAATRSLIVNFTTHAVGDSGFGGFEFHPDGRSFFTFATEPRPETGATNHAILRRWPFNQAAPDAPIPLSSSAVLLDMPKRADQHAGGLLRFGPDGYLYVTLGDEGGQGDPFDNTQRIDRDFFSAVLRIDVDGRPGSITPNPHPSIVGQYWVPNDNPWVGATSFNGAPVDPSKVRTEFWAVGFRNPATGGFGPNRKLYLGDVGGSKWESAREVTAGSNHGWRPFEGPIASGLSLPDGQTGIENLVAPMFTYPHQSIAAARGANAQSSGDCIMGGVVYSGTKYPDLNGSFLVGDLVNGNAWAIGITNHTSRWIASIPTGVVCWGINPATGDIILGDFYGGKLWTMVPALPVNVPPTLSSTGYFTDLHTMAPAEGVLPNDVNSPFWSDFAIKTRWFSLPLGGVIRRDTNDHWTFPAGFVACKHFVLPTVQGSESGPPIETRFIVKTADGVYGITYRWRADGSDADLVAESGDDTSFLVEDAGIQINQSWHYPSRGECATCHNSTAGFVLGFSTRQFNRMVVTAAPEPNLVNQLIGLSNLGVFDPPFTSVDGLPVLSRPLDETATLEHRFKSYTDVNCAYCHQPGGPGRGTWDARFGVPVFASSIINEPVAEDFGVPGSKVIVPGDLIRSILFRRVADFAGHEQPAEYHMPPLATRQPNDAAVSMLTNYIGSLPGRVSWIVGKEDGRDNEFGLENYTNPPAPGSWTAKDDDFWTAGSYPAGFAGLHSAQVVEQDEPWGNWERALTRGNRVNRLHFTSNYGKPGARLRVRFWSVGWMISGVVQTEPTDHILTIVHRATNGYSNTIHSATTTGPVTLDLPIEVQPGANTIEFSRPGPIQTNPTPSYWMRFDYVKVE